MKHTFSQYFLSWTVLNKYIFNVAQCLHYQWDDWFLAGFWLTYSNSHITLVCKNTGCRWDNSPKIMHIQQNENVPCDKLSVIECQVKWLFVALCAFLYRPGRNDVEDQCSPGLVQSQRKAWHSQIIGFFFFYKSLDKTVQSKDSLFFFVQKSKC